MNETSENTVSLAHELTTTQTYSNEGLRMRLKLLQKCMAGLAVAPDTIAQYEESLR